MNWPQPFFYSVRASILISLAFGSMLFPARAADIEFVTQELPWAIADKPYSPPPLQIRSSGACGRGGIGFSVVGGVLPPGLALSKLGYFSGSPVRTGDFNFGIRISNGCTWTVRRFTLTVAGAPVITISPERLAFTGTGEKTVRVSATWPRLSYRATSSADWLKITPVHGFTPRPSSALTGDEAVVSVDTSSLKPGHYDAIVNIDAWQVTNAARLSVALDVSVNDVSDVAVPGKDAPGSDIIAKPEGAIGKPVPSGTPTSVSRP